MKVYQFNIKPITQGKIITQKLETIEKTIFNIDSFTTEHPRTITKLLKLTKQPNTITKLPNEIQFFTESRTPVIRYN